MAGSQGMSFDSIGGIAADWVAVGMACVSRASRYPDRDDGRDRRRHVDDAFQGIGIGSQAAGIEIGGELDGRHHKADPQAAERNFQRFIHCKILATGAVR